MNLVGSAGSVRAEAGGIAESIYAGEGRAYEDERNARALDWRSEWSRFTAGDYVTSAVLAGILVTSYLALSPATEGRRGGVLFDPYVRDRLRFESESARLRAQKLSDVFQSVLLVHPIAIDSVLLTGLAEGTPETAWQMFAIGTQSFLLTGVLTVLSKNVVSRERPFVASCVEETCGGGGKNKSFISGHAATAFTGAGLVCVHHENLPLYRDLLTDQVTCAAALALATATGVLRIASDEHYATDVIAGAAVGLVSGYLLPRLFYYATSRDLERDAEE